MSSTPIRPDKDPELSEDQEETLPPRLARLDEDKKTAKLWPEVKARLLAEPE